MENEALREPMSKKTNKAKCVICSEYHPATESCLEAWLYGLKSPEINSNKSPNSKEMNPSP